MVGALARAEIRQHIDQEGDAILHCPISELVKPGVVEAYPDEPLRVVVNRMVEKGLTRMPVVDRENAQIFGTCRVG